MGIHSCSYNNPFPNHEDTSKMSQEELIKLLRKNPNKWFTIVDLKKKFGQRYSLNENIRRLHKWNEIKVEPIKVGRGISRRVKYKSENKNE